MAAIWCVNDGAKQVTSHDHRFKQWQWSWMGDSHCWRAYKRVYPQTPIMLLTLHKCHVYCYYFMTYFISCWQNQTHGSRQISSQPQCVMYEIPKTSPYYGIDIFLIFLVIVTVSESKELWPLNQAAFWISDRLHSVLVKHCTAELCNGIVSGL